MSRETGIIRAGTQKKRERIMALDLLRGFFLFSIIINHMPITPQLTVLLTGNGLLFASAAEGFFIISGLLVGYLYSPKIVVNTRQTVEKIWKRALLLYCLSLVTTLAFTFIARLTSIDPTKGNLYTGSFFDPTFLYNFVSLSYTYGWADFLSRYAVFMLLAPFALLLITKGQTRLLAALSTFLWIFAVYIGRPEFTAWQILFVAGMIVGGHLERLRSWFESAQNHWVSYAIVILSAISFTWSNYVTIIYPTYMVYYIPALHLPGWVESSSQWLIHYYHQILPFFDKNTLGGGRLLIALLWFAALFIIFLKYEKVIHRITRGLFNYLGRKSLVSYVIHSIYIFIVGTLVVIFPFEASIFAKTLLGFVILTLVVSTVYCYDQLVTRKQTPQKT